LRKHSANKSDPTGLTEWAGGVVIPAFA